MKPARLLVSCLALGALAGCGNTVHHHHTGEPLPEPAVVEAEPQDEVVVEEEVVEEVVEIEQDEASVVYVEIDVTPDYHRKLRGPAVFNFNTGYVDGWGACGFFNRGRPLADHQVDRLIQVGRRQGDPTGKLGLPGYEEGYRAGARQYRNPFRHRMTLAQVNQLRRAQGLPERTLVVRPGRGLRNETHVHVDGRDHGRRDHKPRWTGTPGGGAPTDAQRAARQKELEDARMKAEIQQKELEAARLKRQTDRIEKIEESKEKREEARDYRKAKIEAARKQREEEQKKQEVAKAQREAELKARLEAAKAQREAERKERELALDAKEAERKAELEQNKKDRDAKRDLRTAARKQKTADRKETLAERKKQRDAEKDAKDKEKAEASARD